MKRKGKTEPNRRITLKQLHCGGAPSKELASDGDSWICKPEEGCNTTRRRFISLFFDTFVEKHIIIMRRLYVHLIMIKTVTMNYVYKKCGWILLLLLSVACRNMEICSHHPEQVNVTGTLYVCTVFIGRMKFGSQLCMYINSVKSAAMFHWQHEMQS